MDSISDANFHADVLGSTTPVLVDFWAEWCGPCKALTPVLEKVAETFKGRVRVVKMDVDECHRTSGDLNISMLPTLLLFKDGACVGQLNGLVPQTKLEDFINKNL